MLLILKKQSKRQLPKHFIEHSRAMYGVYLFENSKYKDEVK